MESIVCLMGSQDVVARIHAALLHAPQFYRAAISAAPGDFSPRTRLHWRDGAHAQSGAPTSDKNIMKETRDE